ncbi:uncharacterized protein si:dkey-250d21.1 [Hoplias malabaricus]|uniref:uncharacterized protein si:dkey-250d21.1 n=1 Tax=Hoplias malabaricus TaxID=27720 RepID=UPI0034628C3D
MPESCAAASCKQSSNQTNVAFFRFPLDPERCKQWLGNCGRPDLQTKTPEYLHRNVKLCSRHFEESLILKESELKCVLKDGAVPTIFNFTTDKDSTQNSGRKRTRHTAAEAPVKAKKTKAEPQAAVVQPTVKEDLGENSVAQNPPEQEEEPDNTEDPDISKAKETLKVYFKETLALTGFSISNNAILSTTKSMGSGPAGQIPVDPICAENIDAKEVLKLGEVVMREEIRNSLRLARFFSIILLDKTNIEGKDQIPVFIRTVSVDGFPQKHLMGFLPCDMDTDNLFRMLVSEISNKWGLRMEHCRGFTYLTTGSLCQKLKEFSCRMLRDFPQVVLAPSDPYAFNMWLIRSLPVLSIQEVVDTVEEVAALLRQSETLMRKLHSKITLAYSHIKGEVDRVKEACQNNWEYGTDAFQTMLEILEPLLNSIGEMCTSALSDVDTAVVEQLLKLKDKLKNFNFIISLVVLKNTLCCVSILNPSLRGIISISSTLQYTISNALKLLNKHLQEIPIFHRKWFSDAVGRAKKLGVAVTIPVDTATNGDAEAQPLPSAEDYYRESLSKMILQYLIDEVKRVLGVEMVRILRWLSLVPSYMADHNFSIRKDKVADANLNNLARPDSFYDELGCWEVKWRHASKRRILPTSVFATLKIPDIGFYPNVQSLLRVLGSIPCINADAEVYGQYDMVLNRYHSYMKEVPAEKRLCNMAFVYINQDVHFNIEDMVQSYVESHPDIIQLLHKDDVMEVQPSATENNANDVSNQEMEEQREMTLDMEMERQKPADCTGADKEALKSALQAAITAACNSQSRQSQGGLEGEVEYVTKSEMNEVLKVCEDVVREGILSEVGSSFFSLFIDRAVKMGEADFLPLFLRFVDSFDVMRLELMGFVDASLDTESMCEHLFDIVTKEWHLDLRNCRGQAYLGSGEVSYKLKAFACKVQETHPLAICTHCSCYSFNTWWSRSVPVSSVSRAIDTLDKVVLFFSSMPDLEKELDQVLAVGLRESYEKVHDLQGNFCSSWLEKHDSYDVFAQILEPLAQCLESFQSSNPESWSLAVVNQAKKLLQMIRDFDFIVALVALKNVSSFTRELSASLQKDHFSAASQLCQISGIVATLNRVKTNIKVFHQNWFDEACAFGQNLGVQIKVPDAVVVPRDSLLKPGGYYKDAVSLPLVDHLINSVKDHFSDDHKEALNFLSLVPCSVTVSYTFESLKSKPPLYIGDLPDPENFFTELSCWKVKWKTKVVSPTIPDTIFQTLRLPLMQYFANINTLLKIMCVLPSTALEYCGEVKHHKMFQDYLRETYAKDRSPCLAMLQVGANFNRDLDRMVTQCLKLTPKTLEGICLDKESKTLLKYSEAKDGVDNHTDEAEYLDSLQIIPKDKIYEIFPDCKEVKAEGNRKAAVEEMDTQPVSAAVTEEEQTKVLDENGHSVKPADNLQSSEKVFRVAARMARRNCLFSDLPKEEQDGIIQELSSCHWSQENIKCLSDGEILENVVKSTREAILSEVQESPFFSIITDKGVFVEDKRYIPVFVRYVDDCTPKVELLGFMPFEENSEADVQAKDISDILTEGWGLQMGYCRGQSFMCMGASSQSLRKVSLDFLASYPLAVNTPSESCGLAYWLAVSLHNEPITKVLGVVEDLLLFFDQSPRLHTELSQTMEGLLSTPREALEEVPETCLSKWKKTEDFFDILVDMLDGVLSCLDSVSNNASGTWSNSMSIQALILSTAIRESDFVIPLVILKNACAPLRNCSTVFRCGNPADIICELEKIPLIMESLNKMLENINAVHITWFEEATHLSAKVAGGLTYPDFAGSFESAEVCYRETVSIPVLSGLIDEMKFNFSDCHLKALKVLSLLPTCNPLPILPEATDKLYTIYHSDVPEPDTVEDDINAWATAWREKYQDSSPPASISETLHHPEAKSLPNVTTLLKIVAVLPSISMECDLMKTTLNSLRTFLRSGNICTGNKTDTVMLLMHRQTLQALEEVMARCMEIDPECHGFLSQMKQNVDNMRINIGLDPAAPDHTVTLADSAIETNASTAVEQEQVYTPVDIVVQSTAERLSAVSTSVQEAGGQETAEEPKVTAQDVSTESVMANRVVTLDVTSVVHCVTAEALIELAAMSDTIGTVTAAATQDFTAEPTTSTKDVKEPVQSITTGSLSTCTLVTTEEQGDRVVALQVEAQSVSTEALVEAEAQSVSTESLIEAEAQSVTTEALVEAEAQSVTTEALVEAEAQSVTTEALVEAEAQSVTTEALVEAEAQSVTTEALVETEAQSVTTEALVETEAQCVTTDALVETEAQCVTTDALIETEAQSVTPKPLAEVEDQSVTEALTNVTAQDIPTEPVTSSSNTEEALQVVATEPVTELPAQNVTTGFNIVSGVSPVALPAAAEVISSEPVREAHGAGFEPVTAAQVVTSEPDPAAMEVTETIPATQDISSQPDLQHVASEPDSAVGDVLMEFAKAAELAAQGVTTELLGITQTSSAAQGITSELLIVVEAPSVATDPVKSVQFEHTLDLSGTTPDANTEVTTIPSISNIITEPFPAIQGITIEPSAPASQDISPETAREAEVQDINTDPDSALEDTPMDLSEETEYAAREYVPEVPAEVVTTDPESATEDVPMELPEEVEGTVTEAETDLAVEHVAAEPLDAPQEFPMDLANPETQMADQDITTDSVASDDFPLDLSETSHKLNTEDKPLASNTSEELGKIKHEVTEPNTAAQGISIEPAAAAAQNLHTDPTTEILDKTQEHVTSQDVSMEPVKAQFVTVQQAAAAAPDVVLGTTVSQGVAIEPETLPLVSLLETCVEPTTVAQDVAIEPTSQVVSYATEDTSQTQSMSIQSTANDQAFTTEPLTAVLEIPAEFREDVQNIASEPITAGLYVTTETTTTVLDIPEEPVEEHRADVHNATLKPIAAGMDTHTEPESEFQDIPADPKAVALNVTAEPRAAITHSPAEPVTSVPDIPKEPVEEHGADVQNATTTPKTAILDTHTEPVSEIQNIPAGPKADVQNVTTEPGAATTSPSEEPVTSASESVPESKLDEQHVTSEPIAVALDIPTKPAVETHSIPMESTTENQDMTPGLSSPSQCAGVKPMLENQGVFIKPTRTAVHENTTKLVTTVQGDTVEPLGEVKDDNVECVPSGYLSITESVAEVTTKDVTATEDVAMEVAEETQAAAEHVVMVQGVSSETVVAQDVTMHTDATSVSESMEPVAVQDVDMEAVVETQEVAQDVTMEVDKGVQDVAMETVTADQDVSVEPVSAAQNIRLPVSTAAEDESSQSKGQAVDHVSIVSPEGQGHKDIQPLISKNGAYPATMTTRNITSQETAALHISPDISTIPAEDVTNQAKINVQDGVKPSCSVSQDGTAQTKVVTQAAGPDKHHQTHGGALTHNTVLSFYDSRAQEALLRECAKSKFFSIIFEQQVEIEGHLYIPVGIRYFEKQTLFEDVLFVVPLDKNINRFVDSVTRVLSENCGLNLDCCRGQSFLSVGFEGAQMRAVASLLSQRYPQAVRTLSSSVSLNTWLSRSSTVIEITESFKWVERTLHWLREDAEKQAKLQNIVMSLFWEDESKHTELRDKLSRCHWEESHDVLEFTLEIIEAITLCLNELTESLDSAAERTEAVNFLSIFQSFQFILSVVINKNILSLTKPFSQSLQGGSLDLYQAVNSLPDLLFALSDMGANVDCHLQTWFQEAVVLSSKLKIDVDHTSREPLIVHYREVVSKGAIEHTIKEMKELFSDQVLSALRCMQVVPYVVSKMEGCCTDTDDFKVCWGDLPERSSLKAELQKWRQRWVDGTAPHQSLASSVLDSLKISEMKSFPNIEVVLQLLLVLPCCRREALIRQGKKGLLDFVKHPQRNLPVLYPL